MAFVFIDIGATTTRLAVSENLRSFGAVKAFKTSASYQKALERIQSEITTLQESDIEGVIAGIRGQLDDEKKSLVADSILTDWVDKPLADDLAAQVGAPVYVENNAALSALGEATYGAGEGHAIVVYHTISTGVGGAKIESGRIDANRGSFEPGQQILDIDHTILGEDIEPTLENLVSGRAVAERLGVEPHEVAQSDAVWDQLAYFLAHGLRNSILYWSPDIIVLGGPMILGNPHIDIDSIISYTNEVVGEVTEVPLIVAGTLADEVCLHGARAYANQLS